MQNCVSKGQLDKYVLNSNMGLHLACAEVMICNSLYVGMWTTVSLLLIFPRASPPLSPLIHQGQSK